jgi:hypothetical protein
MTTTYCVDADIKAIFGVSNCDTWADLDNDANATNMAARMDEARVHAYNDINNRLRMSHYQIPIVMHGGSIPHEVTHIEAIKAGVLLSLARGQEDAGPGMEVWAKSADEMLEEVMSQKVRLDAL